MRVILGIRIRNLAGGCRSESMPVKILNTAHTLELELELELNRIPI